MGQANAVGLTSIESSFSSVNMFSVTTPQCHIFIRLHRCVHMCTIVRLLGSKEETTG